MYKVLLVCAGGMSTSFILKKIEKAAKDKNINLLIKAVGALEVRNIWNEFDIFLVAPQVKFEKQVIEKTTQNTKKVELIDSIMYGKMDGQGILDLILSL